MSNIQDVRSINDIQLAYMFEVDIYGGVNDSLDNLTVYAKTVTIPQVAVEQIIINHKASKSHYAGRDSAAHTATLTFWDDEALTIYNYFNDWMEIIHNSITGGSATRDLYAAQMVIKLKDKADQSVTGKITLGQSYPIDLSDITMSYDTSDAIEISVTMSFDSKITE